jgi:hypothetical protein
MHAYIHSSAIEIYMHVHMHEQEEKEKEEKKEKTSRIAMQKGLAGFVITRSCC